MAELTFLNSFILLTSSYLAASFVSGKIEKKKKEERLKHEYVDYAARNFMPADEFRAFLTEKAPHLAFNFNKCFREIMDKHKATYICRDTEYEDLLNDRYGILVIGINVALYCLEKDLKLSIDKSANEAKFG